MGKWGTEGMATMHNKLRFNSPQAPLPSTHKSLWLRSASTQDLLWEAGESLSLAVTQVQALRDPDPAIIRSDLQCHANAQVRAWRHWVQTSKLQRSIDIPRKAKWLSKVLQEVLVFLIAEQGTEPGSPKSLASAPATGTCCLLSPHSCPVPFFKSAMASFHLNSHYEGL